jgi:hypothetical protein
MVGIRAEKKTARNAQRCKPKKASSAYNIFFRDERARILAEAAKEKIIEDKKDKTQEAKKQSEGTHEKMKPGTAKIQGLISFEQLGKKIGQEWRTIAPERKKYYVGLAKKDTERYKREKEDYHAMEESILEQYVVLAYDVPEEPKGAIQQQPANVLHVHAPPSVAAGSGYNEPLHQLAALMSGCRDQAGNAHLQVQDSTSISRVMQALSSGASASPWLLDRQYLSALPHQHPVPAPLWQQQLGQHMQSLSGPYAPGTTNSSESVGHSLLHQAMSYGMLADSVGSPISQQGGQHAPPQMRSFSGQHEPHQVGGIDHMQHRLLVDQFAAAYRSAIPQQQASGYAARLQQQDMLRSFERTIAVAQQERQSGMAARTRHR